jgi:DNA repair protein RadC
MTGNGHVRFLGGGRWQQRPPTRLKEAVRRNSAAIILCHNHPSGQVDPSPEDVLVTREIVQAGKLLDVDVIDHLILAAGRWLSMRERGLGFNR